MADSIRIEKVSDTLPSFVKKIINENQNFKTTFLVKLANEFLQSIRTLAPKRTGNYANSWVISKIGADYVEVATPKGKLALILEYGSAPHPIFPKKRKTLHWVNEAGEDVFALYVRHPGTPRLAHIFPSVKWTETKIGSIAAELIKQYYKL